LRVHVLDPPAYTPPYDHALCAALARRGLDVTLFTTRFPYGTVPAPDGYRAVRAFYRRAGRGGARARRLARLVQHGPDLVRYRRGPARSADIVHVQWLALPQLDAWLAPRGRPLVVTAHDVLAREASPGQRAGQRRLYARADRVVVHSAHGADRLREELGIDPAAVQVIPHGAFHHLTELAPAPLPPELRAAGAGGPVVLCFGLIRPYKGVDVLLDAWRVADLPPDARLWIAGMPRMDVEPLRRASPPSVTWVPRFVSDAESAALLRAADLVVAPYRQIDQSGVLFAALAFGKPLLLTAVGGFPEIAALGAAELVAPGDPAALAAALGALLADPGRRAALAGAARAAAAPDGPLGWDAIARSTSALYASLVHA
jgi:glycosyltransferase involved in cell wall biosynthesis